MAPKRKTQEKTAKACKAMKPLGICAETVKSTLTRLLEAYEMNWTYIEEDNYRVLLDAIFEPDGPKTVKHDFSLRDESEEEETEPLEKKARSSAAAAAAAAAGTSSAPCSRSKYASEMQLKVETDVGTTDILEDHPPMPQFEIPLLIQPAPPGHLHEKDCSSESLVEGGKLMALEYNNLDSSKGSENENEDVSTFSPQIHIAASNGEVKLSFSICNPPPPPEGFRVPSLDAVMKQVEDRYRQRFKALGPQFSISKLFKDICATIMEQGNASSDAAAYKHNNLSPTFDNLKEPPEQQVDQSNAPHNPTDDPAPIPRYVVSNAFSESLRKQQMLGFDELSDCSSSLSNTPTDDLVQFPRFVVSSALNHVGCVNTLMKSRVSSSLTVFPKQHTSCDLYYSVADITRGLEKQEISLINEFNDEMLPAFTYIENNVNYKTANVKFMLARISDENCCSNCFGDCLSPPQVPCACAAETGGEFAYTVGGSIKEDFLTSCIAISLNPTKENYFYCDNCPLERIKKRTQSGSCRGHLVRKFIKECWYKCGCGLNCSNRVVQRGIQAKLQVFMTPEGKGWGVRSLEDLCRGSFVCEYVGEIVTNSELFQRNEENKDEKHTYPVLLDADWSSEGFLKDEEALCLDATCFGNVARFINHRCEDANMVEIPVEVESPDHHYYHHGFFTTREVKAMEELTWDYGIDFDDDSHPVKAFDCKCGSKFCRKIEHGKRNRLGSDNNCCKGEPGSNCC